MCVCVCMCVGGVSILNFRRQHVSPTLFSPASLFFKLDSLSLSLVYYFLSLTPFFPLLANVTRDHSNAVTNLIQ